MLPLELSMKNFMAYAGPVTLDLRGLHLACLSGDNGAGKSTILDAMTWALWGKSRAKSDRGLVRGGEVEMEATLTFDAQGETCRVVRRWDGECGLLDLQRWNENLGGFSSVSGQTMRKTQGKIDALCGMDYDTFVNSAFLLQNRADEFTIKPPGERKAILAKMLGLDSYAAFEKRAKDALSTAQGRLTYLVTWLADANSKLSKEDELQKSLAEWTAKIGKLNTDLKTARQARDEAQKRIEKIDALLTKKEEAKSNFTQAEVMVRRAEIAVQEVSGAMRDLEALLSRKDEVQANYEKLQAIRRELAEQEKLHLQDAALEMQAGQLVREIELCQKANKEKFDALDAEFQECARKASGIEESSKKAQALEVARLDVASAKDLQRQLADRTTRLSAQYEALRVETDRLKEDMAATKESMELLSGAGACCPICGEPLDEEKRQSLLAAKQAEGKTLSDAYRDKIALMKNVQREEAEAGKEVAELEAEISGEGDLLNRIAQNERLLDEARAASDRQAQITAKMSNLDAVFQQEIDELRRRTARIESQREAVNYDDVVHAVLADRARALANAEEERTRIEAATARQEESAKLLAERTSALKRATTERDGCLATIEAADDELAKLLPGSAQILEESKQLTMSLETALGKAQEEIGALRGQLAALTSLREEEAAMCKEKGAVAADVEDYTILARAFGKTGIPALLIESALPELEVEANALLGRLSNDQMRVSFKSQKETLKGDVRETLDIHISDEAGTRSYELYSGGEKFRINFAIRVALSKLLAHRSGVPLRVLFIDEGFGSQDAHGRARLVEAISAVQEEFDLVLVITHIDELRDAFPVRINVRKTENGATLEVEK